MEGYFSKLSNEDLAKLIRSINSDIVNDKNHTYIADYNLYKLLSKDFDEETINKLNLMNKNNRTYSYRRYLKYIYSKGDFTFQHYINYLKTIKIHTHGLAQFEITKFAEHLEDEIVKRFEMMYIPDEISVITPKKKYFDDVSNEDLIKLVDAILNMDSIYSMADEVQSTEQNNFIHQHYVKYMEVSHIYKDGSVKIMAPEFMGNLFEEIGKRLPPLNI